MTKFSVLYMQHHNPCCYTTMVTEVNLYGFNKIKNNVINYS
jgi:hypothetical protein